MDLYDDIVEHILCASLSQRPSTVLDIRVVCSAWKAIADSFMIKHYEHDIAGLLSAMQLTRRIRISSKQVLTYALNLSWHEVVYRYKCASCGQTTTGILTCDCLHREKRERRTNRTHLKRAFVGPLAVIVTLTVLSL